MASLGPLSVGIRIIIINVSKHGGCLNVSVISCVVNKDNNILLLLLLGDD